MKTRLTQLIIFLSFLLLLSACSQNTNESPNSNNADNNGETQQEEQTETETVILYYSDNELMNIYKINAEIQVESEKQLEQAAIDAWIAGPESDGLTSLLPSGTTAEFVRSEEGTAYVSFSEQIRSATVGSGGEAAIVDQITMLMEQFGYDRTQILVEGEVVSELLGHMTYDEPFEARSKDDFEWYNESVS